MRILLTSFQGSGTHQIMPALGIMKNLEDRSWSELVNMPANLGLKENTEGVRRTIKDLREFKDKVFGHISYREDFVDAVQSIPTKVVFNVRDPRDVVVSDYHKILKMKAKGKTLMFFDFKDADGVYTHDKDIIHELIVYASCRWPRWLGWLKHDFTYKIKYEDIRQKPLDAFTPLEQWLHPIILKSADDMAQGCRPVGGNPTFRTGLVGEWKTTFSDEHKKLAENLLGDILSELGYSA